MTRSVVHPVSDATPGEASVWTPDRPAIGWTERPWGSFEVLAHGPRHLVKRLVVAPGGVLSLQHHVHRAEHWLVVSGRGAVQVGAERWVVGPDDRVTVPVGALHRLECVGPEPLVVIEVQTGDRLTEDDIVRHEDVYGRVTDG